MLYKYLLFGICISYDVGVIVVISLSISEFCENLLKEDNSNNTFSDVMSQRFGAIFERKVKAFFVKLKLSERKYYCCSDMELEVVVRLNFQTMATNDRQFKKKLYLCGTFAPVA